MRTFVIDGNFLFMRIVTAMGTKFLTENECTRFRETFLVTLSSIIRKHAKYIDIVAICKDASSWRKKITQVVPKELVRETIGYKQNRVKENSDKMNWTQAFKTFDDIMELLDTTTDIHVYRTEGAEGDDWIWLLSQIALKSKQELIIYSSDGDIKQLVKDTVYLYKMPTEVLLVGDEVNLEVDYFSNAVSIVSEIKAKETQKIYGFNTLLSKILSGDPKDNVAPLFFWKSGRCTYTPKFSSLEKEFGTRLDPSLIYNEDWIEKCIQYLFKKTKQERDPEHTKNVFISNRKFLALNSKEIPEVISRKMFELYQHQKQRKPSTNVSKWSDYRTFPSPTTYYFE